MAEASKQGELFDAGAAGATTTTTISVNARCVLRTEHGCRVVFVAGLPMAHFAVGDRMASAYAMVTIVEHGWADQNEVARAFECSARTVRRTQRRFEKGGLAALGRGAGYPKGRARLRGARSRRVHDLKAQGQSNRAIAARLGVTEKAVRKLLRRLGWKPPEPEQRELPLGPAGRMGADPNLSASATTPSPISTQEPEKTTAAPVAVAPSRPETPSAGADPNLAASVTDVPASTDAIEEPLPITFDTDPADRHQDRLYAHLGLLADAMPMFREGSRIPRAGVLLAMPALLDTGVLDCARDIYGSIGPAFYGLRTSIVAMLVMALLRIKRPEALKEQSPAELGRLLGLDRAPEVKTLRRKLTRLSVVGRATDFGRALATRRVAARGQALGFLYVDGHVRVYHGKRTLPKAHVAQRHLPMPATTDYWINDAGGDPLFVVTAEANAGLVKMLPPVLDEMRKLVGKRRITIVFDRGGWSPRLFQKIVASGFDVLTYRKGRFRRVARARFHLRRATFDGRKVSYVLADQRVRPAQRPLRVEAGHAPHRRRPSDTHHHLARRPARCRGRLPHVRALAPGELFQVPLRGVCARRACRLPRRARRSGARGAQPPLERARRRAASGARDRPPRLRSLRRRRRSQPRERAQDHARLQDRQRLWTPRDPPSTQALHQDRGEARGRAKARARPERRRRDRDQARRRAKAPDQPHQDGCLPSRERPRPRDHAPLQARRRRSPHAHPDRPRLARRHRRRRQRATRHPRAPQLRTSNECGRRALQRDQSARRPVPRHRLAPALRRRHAHRPLAVTRRGPARAGGKRTLSRRGMSGGLDFRTLSRLTWVCVSSGASERCCSVRGAPSVPSAH